MISRDWRMYFNGSPVKIALFYLHFPKKFRASPHQAFLKYAERGNGSNGSIPFSKNNFILPVMPGQGSQEQFGEQLTFTLTPSI